MITRCFINISLFVSYIKLYIIWIIIHYMSSFLYFYICTPIGIYGFIISPLMVISPQCNAIYWTQSSSREIIKNMWIFISMFLTNTVFNYIKPINN